MQIDAIVSDLDDTLLNEDSVLSPYTLDVMARARDRGIRVIPASGRAAFSMLRFLRQLNTGMPYIACNGGQLVGPDHVVTDEFTFSAQEAQAIIRYLKSHGFTCSATGTSIFTMTRNVKPARATVSPPKCMGTP